MLRDECKIIATRCAVLAPQYQPPQSAIYRIAGEQSVCYSVTSAELDAHWQKYLEQKTDIVYQFVQEKISQALKDMTDCCQDKNHVESSG